MCISVEAEVESVGMVTSVGFIITGISIQVNLGATFIFDYVYFWLLWFEDSCWSDHLVLFF
jgi:hypothetical protein